MSFFPLCPLLSVFGFLPGRATAVGTGDVLFLLGFCLHLALIGVFAFAATAEVDAILQYQLEIIVIVAHNL